VAALKGIGIVPASTKAIDHGVQYVLPEGTIVNVFQTGKALVQGKKTDERRRVEELLGPKAFPAVPISASLAEPVPILSRGSGDGKVFIVYGHDKTARNALELLLTRLNIKPVILSNLAPDGKTIIEALIANSDVQYAIVLLTPDDEGHRIGHPNEKKPRARQNVVLELGMFLIKLGRERVAILHKGDLELPSDIGGLIYISFKDDVNEAKNKLAAALQKAGFYISVEALSAE
jgi:predicted nucleotide-binding protein